MVAEMYSSGETRVMIICKPDKWLKVDYVQVEINGGGDVLLRGDPGHDHLQTERPVLEIAC
jgi:hypothetical protein